VSLGAATDPNEKSELSAAFGPTRVVLIETKNPDEQLIELIAGEPI